MTNQTISLDVEPRTIVRKRLAGLKKQGLVPAVIHNHGKESMHVTGEFIAITKMYQQAGKHHPVQIKLDGKQHLALIKGVDFEPSKHQIRHVVFQAIRQNETTEADIPLVFKEDVEIPAEKKSLLVLQQIDTILVKALPRDLPDQLVVDPSSLSEAGDNLTVADIIAPKGVEILADSEQQVAIVEVPKDQIAEADAAAESLAEDAGTAGVEVPTEAPSEDE